MSEILGPKKDSKKSQNVAGLKNVKVAWNKHLNMGWDTHKKWLVIM